MKKRKKKTLNPLKNEGEGRRIGEAYFLFRVYYFLRHLLIRLRNIARNDIVKKYIKFRSDFDILLIFILYN